MAQNIFTIIEVTDSHVRVVQSKGGPVRPIVVGVDIKPILTPTDEGLVKAVFDATRSKSISIDQLLFVIPRRFVILKKLHLPSQQDMELRKMIGLQLVNQIPYSVDEVTYDYQIIEKDGHGYTDVLVFIVNRLVTKKYVSILEQAGLKMSRMTMSSFGLVNWWAHQERIKKAMGVPVLLVHVDHAHSEICFCQGSKLLFSRNVNYGERDLTPDGVVAFSKQVGLSYTNYQRQKMGPEIKKICVISNFSEGNLLKQQLERELNLFVEVASPFDNISSAKKLNLENSQNQPGLALAIPTGFQFADFKHIVNLIPSEVHRDKQQSVRKKEWVRFAIGLVVAFCLGAAVFGMETYFKHHTLIYFKKKNKELRPQVAEIERRVNFLDAFNEKLKSRMVVSTLINKLYSITPPDISFRSILLDEKRMLTLQGYAQVAGGAGVNAFQEALVSSKEFSAVNLEFATKRRIFNMEVTDFKIVINLKSEKK